MRLHFFNSAVIANSKMDCFRGGPHDFWLLAEKHIITAQGKNLKNTTSILTVSTWAFDTVMWYWSAHTLFWQLSIHYNLDVSYQVAGSLTSYLGKCEKLHWFPAMRTNGRSLEYQNFLNGQWNKFSCFACAHFALAWSSSKNPN